MGSSATFTAIFLATIIVTRVALFVRPTPSPTVGGFRMHHWMFGVVLVPLGIFLHSVWIYAIGIGLFVDELGYLFIRGKNHADNYSDASLALTCFFVVLTIIFSNELVLAI